MSVYVIEWNHHGEVSSETHKQYPGIKYIHDVLRNSRGKVDAVLYYVVEAESSVVERRLRREQIRNGYALQHHPLIEAKINGAQNIITIAKGTKYFREIVSKYQLNDLEAEIAEFDGDIVSEPTHHFI